MKHHKNVEKVVIFLWMIIHNEHDIPKNQDTFHDMHTHTHTYIYS